MSIRLSILLLFAVFVITGCTDHEANRLQTQLNGDVLILALEEFHKEHHVYPENLNQLIEKDFLEEIPEALWGLKEWNYTVYKEDDEFVLSVYQNEGKYPLIFHDGDGWYYDT